MAAIWQPSHYDNHVAEAIQKQLGVSKMTSALLALRGITQADQADYFLNAGLEALSDPLLMEGVGKAILRIKQAIECQERVVVYGDYDVDGICSVVILTECLQHLGCRVDYYVPDRFTEGYGLNMEAISSLAEQGCQLLITVDCGIGSVEEVELALTKGMDIIITDHHNPPAALPAALAVINPKLGSPPTAANLAGAGVAFKLATALAVGRGLEQQMQEWLALAALATVADMVPLQEENRIITKYGLAVMRDTQRIGLRALIDEAGLTGQVLKAWQLGFVLGPRLNAAGRMDNARIGIDLLMSRDLVQARDQARLLGQMNSERRRVEDDIFHAAVETIDRMALDQEPVIIVGGLDWNVGVVGIVASRLLALYNRPAIVISWTGDIGKGSARSGEGFDLYMALDNVRASLLSFGGHKMAAGLSLHHDDLEKMREGLRSYAAATGFQADKDRRYQFDLEIAEDDINPALVAELSQLEPFGEGNPVPAFVLRGENIHTTSRVGVNRPHLRMRIGSGNIPGIAFNRAEEMEETFPYCSQDLLFEVDENFYIGKKTIQLKVKDIKPAFAGDDRIIGRESQADWPELMRRAVDEIAARRPVIFVYPTLRCQVKQQAAINYCFRRGSIVPITGHLWPEERRQRQEMLKQGLAGIYLMTASSLGFYLKSAQLPPNLHFMAILGPGLTPFSQYDLPSQVEVIYSGRGHDRIFYSRNEDYGTHGRILVYANLPGTIRRLKDSYPDLQIESGLADMRQRIDLRRRYWSNRSGALVSDGTHTVESSHGKVFDELVLADSPFGAYELQVLAARIGGVGSDKVGVAFDRSALEVNRQFLERSYPNSGLVNQVLTHLLRLPGNRCRLSDLIGDMNRELDISRLEAVAALHILADLNLCRFQKRSSIMAINRGSAGNYIDSLDGSPYSQEGNLERLAFADWEERLISGLEW